MAETNNGPVTPEELARINALARKSKAEGLTEEEAAEQKALRARYIAAVRANLRSQLDNIDILEHDGRIENLGRKFGSRTQEEPSGGNGPSGNGSKK